MVENLMPFILNPSPLWPASALWKILRWSLFICCSGIVCECAVVWVVLIQYTGYSVGPFPNQRSISSILGNCFTSFFFFFDNFLYSGFSVPFSNYFELDVIRPLCWSSLMIFLIFIIHFFVILCYLMVK